MLLVLSVILSVSAISASEVNVTDSYTTGLVDDTTDASVPMENTADSSVLSVSNVDNDSSKVSLSSEEGLESENSNTLSTNSDSNGMLGSDDGVTAASDKLEASGNVSSTIDISKTITSKDITKYYKGSTQYTATFFDNQGNVLNNTKVNINVNGVEYTKKTDTKGVASLDVNLKPGSYKVIATNPVTGYRLANTFTVLSTISASDITKVYTDGRAFTAKFFTSSGGALANKNVKFKINGKKYTVKTNSKGVASLSLTNLAKGKYKIKSYNTDGLTAKNTVKVVASTTSELKTATYTFLTTDTKKIKVKLLNGLGYAPGKGKTINIKIDGKTYTAKTNAKGKASLKLPSLAAGTYTVKYSFDGNNFYSASKATDKVYIIPSKDAKLTVKSTTKFNKDTAAQFKVALTSGSVPLVDKSVEFSVNGQSYTKTTDSDGIASLPISLAPGKYTIAYSFAGDSKLNAASGSSAITVSDKSTSKITWKSATSFNEGTQTFEVLLQDGSGKALANKPVVLTINSKTYKVNTASNGYATFNLNLDAGTYKALFDFSGDSAYESSSGSESVTVSKKLSTGYGYGYWVFGADMKSVNLKELSSQGTTDIFLNFYAVTKHGKSSVESWIASANKVGIRVHIWMQAFYQDGSWINPVKNGSPNTALFNTIIDEAKSYAKLKGVAGIHFDYLRYPGNAYNTAGGTEAINQFVKSASEAIHGVNSDLIVSAAVMPETSSNIYYYGQDMSSISKYLDVVIPMIYKGNYNSGTSWITSVTKWFVSNSKGAQVWAGLQGYRSDDDVTKLSASEIKKDSQAALDGKATGVIIFRWGVTNFVNFKSLNTKLSSSESDDSSSSSSDSSSASDSKSVSVSDIVAAANTLAGTIKSKSSIPATVNVGGVSYTAPQFLYLMGRAIENINAGKASTQIEAISVSAADNPSGSVSSGDLTMAQYLDVASRVCSFISTNGQAPNYASSSLGNIKYDSLVDIFARTLEYYKSNAKLPASVSIGDASSSSSTTTATASKTISLKDVVTGATNLKKYYDNNGELPNTVTAGGVTFKLPEFLYLMSQAIYQINSSNANDIAYISGVSDPSGEFGDDISSTDFALAKYVVVAKNVAAFISSNKQAPNYASSDLGRITYSELVDAFSRVLAYYGSNNTLPGYVTISCEGSSYSATGSGLNEKNTITNLAAYLKSSTNCQVGNSNIKAVVDSLIDGLTSDMEKATAIFNYVRDTISYSFYYDTKYGAAGTLSSKAGNCVDHSHLLVAMFRTAGLAARYVHGVCTFSSGSVYGHVWAQVLVDGKWIVADATSNRNSLGNVNNWNTNSFTLNGIYSSLSF